MVSDEAPVRWVELAFEGQWLGNEAGPFEFTRQTFEDLIENFDAIRNEIPVTYEHPPPHARRPACGWIHALRLRKRSGKTAIEGLVEMGPDLAEDVRTGGYRFCSVVVSFDATDRVTGEGIGPFLHEVGVTNSPFLDDQLPMALTAGGWNMAGKKTSKGKPATAAASPRVELTSIGEVVESALDLLGADDGADASPETLRKVAADIMAQAERLANAGGGGDGAAEGADVEAADEVDLTGDVEEAVALEEGAGVGDLEALIMEMTGAATIEEAVEALKTMMGGAGEEAGAPALSAAQRLAERRALAAESAMERKDQQLRRLSARVAELEAVRTEERIAAAIAAGHFPAEWRDDLVKLAAESPAAFARQLALAAKHPIGGGTPEPEEGTRLVGLAAGPSVAAPGARAGAPAEGVPVAGDQVITADEANGIDAVILSSCVETARRHSPRDAARAKRIALSMARKAAARASA